MLPELDPVSAVRAVAAAGYQGIEWRVVPWKRRDAGDSPPSYWHDNHCTIDFDTLLERCDAVGRLSQAAGLETPILGTYLDLHDVRGVDTAMRAAAIMRCPRIRVRVPRFDRGRTYLPLLQQAREHLAEIERLGRKHGISALIELHQGTICPSVGLACRLLEGADPRFVGAIYDPGNLVVEGFEDWRLGLEVLGPYLAHVHVNNAQWSRDAQSGQWTFGAASLQEGMVDWQRVLRDLQEVGYDGWLSLEDFSSAPTEQKLNNGIAYLRALA
jgi:sugar phosphate isomerase/epimerase